MSEAPWEDLLQSKAVLKQVVRSSSEADAARPEFKQPAIVHLIGRLADASHRIFVNTYANDKPLEVVVGDQLFELVPPGVMLAVRMMAVGEKCRVKVVSRYGYGPTGTKEYDVPPDSDLEYEIELLDVREFPKEPAEMSLEELAEAVALRKQRANEFFEWDEKEKALRLYNEALKIGEAANSQNLTLAELEKQQKWKECKEASVNALSIDNNNVKALVRAARACTHRGEHDEAEQAFTLALKLDPANPAALAGMKTLLQAADKARRQEQAAFGGFLKPAKPKPASSLDDNDDGGGGGGGGGSGVAPAINAVKAVGEAIAEAANHTAVAEPCEPEDDGPPPVAQRKQSEVPSPAIVEMNTLPPEPSSFASIAAPGTLVTPPQSSLALELARNLAILLLPTLLALAALLLGLV